MAHIVVAEPFDMDRLASQFPGKLKFTGAASMADGDTEVAGDVDQDELIAALQSCLVTPVSLAVIDPQPSRIQEYTPDEIPLPPTRLLPLYVEFASLIYTVLSFILLIVILVKVW